MDKLKRLSIVRDIRNKDSPWGVRWFEPTDLETGKRRRRCRSFPTKQEARTFAAELRLERPAARVSGGVTLGQICGDYLSIIKAKFRPSTYTCCEGTVRRLKAHFGEKCKLDEITPQGAEEFITHLTKIARGREGKPLSIPSRRQHAQNCKTIFNKAVTWGKLRENPFAGVRRVKVVPGRWHRLSPAEFLALVDAAPDLQTKCLYALLYTAGLRLNEALSLRWCDIDFERSSVTIASRKGTDDWPPFDVKDHEARSIPLPTFTMDLLTAGQDEAPEGVPYVLLSKQRYERVKAKSRLLRKQGRPWLNRYLANNTLRNFKKHVKRAGIVPVGSLTIHGLRKNAGQNWADRLPMNVVAAFMGHADIATTQKFYSQVDGTHQQIAATAIQDMLADAEQKAGKQDVCDTYITSPAKEKS